MSDYADFTEEQREQKLRELGYSIESEYIGVFDDGNFVGTKMNVTLFLKGKEVLTSEYRKGIGHFQRDVKDILKHNLVSVSGYSPADLMRNADKRSDLAYLILKNLTESKLIRRYKHLPSLNAGLVEFIYSITCGATTELFEDWCSEFGCDTDSIKAKKIWEACIDTYLKLCRAGVDIEELRLICEGY